MDVHGNAPAFHGAELSVQHIAPILQGNLDDEEYNIIICEARL